MRHLLSVRFTIQGDLRFISHHDTLRLFERALARADIPVRRSDGFNPRPKLSLPLPRSVGVASLDERLIVELHTPLSADEAARRIAPQLPQGMQLIGVDAVGADVPRSAAAVSYEMVLTDDEASAIAIAAARFAASDRAPVHRTDPKTGRGRDVDLRAWVAEVVVERNRLRWTQSISGAGTARPGEVLEAVGLSPTEYLHRLVRTAVRYDAVGSVDDPPGDDPGKELS